MTKETSLERHSLKSTVSELIILDPEQLLLIISSY